jgi:transcriptional regulator with XRE-family HTH domain
VTLDIGDRLKRLRLANNLTQEELANRTGLTKGYISQLERNHTSPSLATLKDLLDVFAESFANFFKEDTKEVDVYRRTDRIILTESTDTFRVELLVQASQKREMEPVLVTLASGAQTWEDRYHKGQEFGFVLQGTIMLQLGHAQHELGPGDCFYFTADRRHLVRNIGADEAKLVWVVTPPTF